MLLCHIDLFSNPSACHFAFKLPLKEVILNFDPFLEPITFKR